MKRLRLKSLLPCPWSSSGPGKSTVIRYSIENIRNPHPPLPAPALNSFTTVFTLNGTVSLGFPRLLDLPGCPAVSHLQPSCVMCFYPRPKAPPERTLQGKEISPCVCLEKGRKKSQLVHILPCARCCTWHLIYSMPSPCGEGMSISSIQMEKMTLGSVLDPCLSSWGLRKESRVSPSVRNPHAPKLSTVCANWGLPGFLEKNSWTESWADCSDPVPL